MAIFPSAAPRCHSPILDAQLMNRAKRTIGRDDPLDLSNQVAHPARPDLDRFRLNSPET
jgi:hypothetical protein